MKKVLCALILIVCVILTGSNVMAATEPQSTEPQSTESQSGSEEVRDIAKEYIEVDYDGADFDFKMIYEEKAEEWIKDIETTCVNSYGIEERDTLKYRHLQFQKEDAFKEYILKKHNVINKYMEWGNFKDNISDEYIIYIPIKNGDECTVVVSSYREHDGIWGQSAFGKTEISHPILFDSVQLSELILTSLKGVNANETENMEESIKTIRIVNMYYYYTIAVYIETTDEEYLLPLTTIDMLTDLELNKLYTAEEFFEVLKLNPQEDMPTDGTVAETTTDVVYNGNRNDADVTRTIDTRIIAVAGICVGVIGIIAVVLVIKRNKILKK